jgi:hypothetical protein
MLGQNSTPFAAIGFEQGHRNGSDMAVIAVRGRFNRQPDGSLEAAEAQDIVLVDQYAGDPQASPLVKAGDLVPFKPATDITILANAYPPAGTEPRDGWLAGVRIEDYRYAVRVFGERSWEPAAGGLKPGKPRSAEPVAIDYRLAWSDLAMGELPADPAPCNPIGVRQPPRQFDPKTDSCRLAQIEALKEDYSDPFATRQPQGFGPLAPFWRERQQFAGTYDDVWLQRRHPVLPEDFDYRFYQCAHPRLVCDGYLNGDEEFELYHLSPFAESVQFRLPAIALGADFLWLDDRKVSLRLNLDGVHIDARGDTVMVDLTWRGWLPICPQFFRIDLYQGAPGTAEFDGLPRPGIDGIEGVDASGGVIA